MEKVLELKGVTKRYGKFVAVDDASFTLERGKIYGFIGQNGAGKTTIIRMIAGVSVPTSGTIELFGDGSEKGLKEGRKKMGAIVEAPALYTALTAHKNLEIQAELYDIKDKSYIDELLQLVGLDACDKRKVKNFSLGMRQRLAIAMALVSNPEFLILDEPVNGLDPMGIVEIRNLLLKLHSERNITILISSHILAELHMLATDYVIINHGKIVECISSKDMEEKCHRVVVMKVEDEEAAKSVLENKLNTTNFKMLGNGFFHISDYVDDVRTIAKAMMDNNILVTLLYIDSMTLEKYFVEKIGGSVNV